MQRSLYRVLLAISAALIAAIVVISYAMDPFLRNRIEREMNLNMRGYHAGLDHAHLSVLGVLSLRNLTIIQTEHPSPTIIHVPNLRISIKWHDLLRGQIVADCLVAGPDIHLNLIQLRTAASGKIALLPPDWQDALRRLHPFTINHFRMLDANITYIDTDPKPAIALEHVSFTGSNFRNSDSTGELYPSLLTAAATVFKTGRAMIHGRGNFLVKPLPALLINFTLDHVPLRALSPTIERVNLNIAGGYLDSNGVIENSSAFERIEVSRLAADQINLEYVHQAATSEAEARHMQAIGGAAARADNQPNLILKVKDTQVSNGTIGYRDEAADPAYRLYIDALNLRFSDLSNQPDQGTSVLTLGGLFMGSGKTSVSGDFRPRQHGPDFDLNCAIGNTQLASMNDMFRRYGRINVQSGYISVYSQATVRGGHISGYVKPLITDLKVHTAQHDNGKSVLHKAYQFAVRGAAKLLRNPSTKTVATKIDLSGKLESPNIGTFQALIQLARNAFIKGIVPGFDRQEQAVSEQSHEPLTFRTATPSGNKAARSVPP